MAVPIKPLTEQFAVAPQLSPEDMAGVAAAGYKSVIINRPDFEGGPDQPTAAAVSKAALEAGLQVEYQPVIGSAMTAADVARFAELLRTLPGPVLAYCRTGTRCTNLFVASQQMP
ncbi:TIGR01244 family sulfur transferase [Bordetella petrii]|uniref:TIGR01244 family sulfur transferase n=1 Tax=Bordetella petrii TaxID=94624 RepID=UPI00372E81FF